MSDVQNDCYATRHLNLCEQYLNEATADIFFICGNDEHQKERIPAHKFVLFANSNVFDKTFHGSSPKKNEIVIPDASPNGFRTFLRYFYFKDCLLDIDVVGEVMCLTKKYNIAEYFDLCCEFLRKGTTAKHILVGHELAIEYGDQELQEYFEYERINNDVLTSDYIRSISLNSLLQIAATFSSTENAKNLFDACMKWAEEACIRANIDPNVMQNRKDQLDSAVRHIQFCMMKRDELIECMTKFWDFFTHEELRRFSVIIAAKSPVPFNRDGMIRYDIGETTLLDTKMKLFNRKNIFCESIRFSSQIRSLLGGIVILPLFPLIKIDLNVSVFKIVKDKEKFGDVSLFEQNYELFDLTSNNDSNSHDEVIFSEAIIVEPNASYCIFLEIFNKNDIPLYCEHSISVSKEFPFQIFPRTGRKIISAFLCNKLS